jgi:hypothetical protein
MTFDEIISSARQCINQRTRFEPSDPFYLTGEQATKELAKLRSWSDQLQADANRWTTKKARTIR